MKNAVRIAVAGVRRKNGKSLHGGDRLFSKSCLFYANVFIIYGPFFSFLYCVKLLCFSFFPLLSFR